MKVNLTENESIKMFDNVMNHCTLEDEQLMSNANALGHAYVAESSRRPSSVKFKKWNKYDKKGKEGLGPRKKGFFKNGKKGWI